MCGHKLPIQSFIFFFIIFCNTENISFLYVHADSGVATGEVAGG